MSGDQTCAHSPLRTRKLILLVRKGVKRITQSVTHVMARCLHNICQYLFGDWGTEIGAHEG